LQGLALHKIAVLPPEIVAHLGCGAGAEFSIL
jgi:hypothetical protein